MSSVVRREGDDAAWVVEGPFEADSQVVVDGDDVIVALRGGAVLGSLGPGRHAPGVPFDLAVFVKRAPQSFRVTRSIAQESGRVSSPGETARVFGNVRFVVEDPAVFVNALGDPRAIHGEGLGQAVSESAGELVERAVRASFERALTDLPSVLGPAAEQWPVPGTRIDFSDLSITSIGASPHASSSREDSRGGREEREPSDGATEQTSLIGAEVSLASPNGRRVRGVIEEMGYLVKLENGEYVWAKLEDIAIE